MKYRLNTKLIASLQSVLHIQASDIKEATQISLATWYRIRQAPQEITVQQLLQIANGLHIPVRRLFSTGQVDVVGQREDYVAEPYYECQYDEAALRDFVSSNHDATWKKAAEAAGMSYQRLRNSLLAVTRTPVARFLEACDTFGIEPFTILVDGNPAIGSRKRPMRKGEADSFKAEINTMKGRIDELSKTVEDLTAKYENLLNAHEQLARSVQVNIDTISGGYFGNIGIAADPTVPRDDD